MYLCPTVVPPAPPLLTWSLLFHLQVFFVSFSSLIKLCALSSVSCLIIVLSSVSAVFSVFPMSTPEKVPEFCCHCSPLCFNKSLFYNLDFAHALGHSEHLTAKSFLLWSNTFSLPTCHMLTLVQVPSVCFNVSGNPLVSVIDAQGFSEFMPHRLFGLGLWLIFELRVNGTVGMCRARLNLGFETVSSHAFSTLLQKVLISSITDSRGYQMHQNLMQKEILDKRRYVTRWEWEWPLWRAPAWQDKRWLSKI